LSENVEQRPRERQRASSPSVQTKGPWLWPLLLTGVGVLLLLDNFLLLGDFNVGVLWPLLLVVVGAAILLRGDIVPSTESKTFGITRGSVESATLEINAGEIDVEIGALQREGRLIAGQYAPQSRPQLIVDGTHTTLKMQRSHTPWLFWGDWQMGLAQDLPWTLYISTHLGQAALDLSQIIVQDATLAPGIGDLRLVVPREAFAPLHLRSTLGDIHVSVPTEYRAHITVQASRLFRAYADAERYIEIEPGIYITRNALYTDEDGNTTLVSDEQYPLVQVILSGTFGDAYLS
jgi:Domain of unknown function (DUF5668)